MQTPLFAQGKVKTGMGHDSFQWGKPVRIKLRNDRKLNGYLVKWNPDYLGIKVNGNDTIIQKADIQIVWVRGRAISTGLKIGAGIGSIVGGLTFYAIGALAHGLCEYDCDSYGTKDQIIAILTGAGFGSLAFGGIGALIGGAFPSWKKVYDYSDRRDGYGKFVTYPFSGIRKIGEIRATIHYTRGISTIQTEGGVIGLNFQLSNQTSEIMSMGPEFGYFNPGWRTEKGKGYQDDRIYLYGWFVRWEYNVRGYYPYLLLGMGVYH